MFGEGDSVTYIGDLTEVKGMVGVVKGPGSGEGRHRVEWAGLGVTLDMSDSVLASNELKGNKMPTAQKFTATHPDGTVSTRNSATMTYTHVVQVREDMWAAAKDLHAKAQERRDAKAKFVEAVRGGRVIKEDSHIARTHNVYVVHDDGKQYWLGHGSDSEPCDRKAGVRRLLDRYADEAARYEREAREAESGPQYRYAVVRWSQSEGNAVKAVAEFTGRNGRNRVYEVLPVD